LKGLKKLKSWDALPSESEAEEIKPLLTQIVQLKAAANKELNSTQLIVFFLQRQIQPLQARVKDRSRVSQSNLTTEEVKKKVRSFTKLTKKASSACLLGDFIRVEESSPEGM
jgi:hypothetical protein